MSPYRASGPLPKAMRDPARARLGLAAGCVGALACFASLTHGYFATFTATDGTLLSLGAALTTVALLYSALDAPSGRALLVVSAIAFSITFLLRPIGGIDPRLFMRTWVWPIRYFAVAGVATGLLLRLRRSRPGASGTLLRLAAIVGTWWGLSWMATWFFAGADHAQRAEALSRVCYLLLALGMLDMRRYLGIVPLEAPVRSREDEAREMATTRVCLAGFSLTVALVAVVGPWSSRWAVLATAETVSAAALFALHLRWLLRSRYLLSAVLSGLASILAVWLAILSFESRGSGPPAVALLCFGVAAIAVDASVASSARPSSLIDVRTARPAFLLACTSITLRGLALAVALSRL